ncbi:hypothetical protein [Knoellia subterranea]|uniref:Glycosyltransferase RgtA/B/C/D-like domain-containing protein n=1 Tax=Knoellia subterranea KCTC 19937 TaxID=1385521 RepID=A0A0A0JQ84_9MICO|nr:hypothetical protein [Knoellia subterranea]KGN38889.1 hypothetical protein N803_08815 [Knoellia subterranea KCTC 19937]
MSSVAQPRTPAAPTALGLLLGGVPFFLILLNFRLDPLRTAVAKRFASNFFDLQATAFLDGRLDVPNGALGIEGFEIGGKTYMYFPPFPALLRVPVQMLTHELDGRLTLLSMALAWAVLAITATRLVWLVRECLRPRTPLSGTDKALGAILLAAITGGTVLTFDAALPWVYHEVYMWATALAVGSAYWLLRVALEPTRDSVAWLGGFVLATALTRTPGGIALSAATMGLGGWLLWRRRSDFQDRRRIIPWAVLGAGLGPAVASVTYNWIKFGHPYLFPLESQVWTKVNAHRREALEINGGTITGPQFLETTLVNYLRPDGIRFVDYFPWITLPSEPAKSYGGAFLDQTYRTGSITAFMPLLCLLCLAAVPLLLQRKAPAAVVALRWPAVGTAVIGGAVLEYGYLAHRYTSDFVPGLVVVGTIGAWYLAPGIDALPGIARRAMVGMMSVLCAFSIAAQMATASLIAAHTHRGDDLTRYLSLQEQLSGGPNSAVSKLVTHTKFLPVDGMTDGLHVVGDCAALYVNTGDQYEPWNVVEQRDMIVTVTPTFVRYRAGKLPLFNQLGIEDRTVSLEFASSVPQARLVIEDQDGNFYSPWFPVERGRPIKVTAHGLPDRFETRISVDGSSDYDLYLPTTEWNKDWYNELTELTFIANRDPGTADHARVSNQWGPLPPLCERLTSQSALGR